MNLNTSGFANQISEITAETAHLSQMLPSRGKSLSLDLQEKIIKLAQKMQFLEENIPQEIACNTLVTSSLSELHEQITNLLRRVPKYEENYASTSYEIVINDTDNKKKPEGPSASSSPPFVSLKSHSPSIKIKEITPNLRHVTCLQQETLPDGKSSCGFHALKNASVALQLVSERGELAKNAGCNFISLNEYKQIKSAVEKVLPQTGSDLTRAEIREAWDAISPNSDNLSIFEVVDSKLGLTAGNTESLTALLNIRNIVQRPGPFHHAFLVGSDGHWITMIAEKDAQGKILWYGIDSLYQNSITRFEMAIEWIEDACKNVDNLAPRIYHEALGHSIATRGKKGDPEVLKDPNFIAECKSAVHFMTEMNFLGRQQEPLVRGEVYSLARVLRHYQKLGVKHPEFDAFLKKYKHEIRKTKLPPPSLVKRERIFLHMQDSLQSRAIRSNFDSLSIVDQKYMIKAISALKTAKDASTRSTPDLDTTSYRLMTILKHIPRHMKKRFMDTIFSALSRGDIPNSFGAIATLGQTLENGESLHPVFKGGLWGLLEENIANSNIIAHLVSFYELSRLAVLFDGIEESSLFYQVLSDVISKHSSSISSHVYENISIFLRNPDNAAVRNNFIIHVTQKLRSETNPKLIDAIISSVLKDRLKLFTIDDAQSANLSDYTFQDGHITDPFVDFLHAFTYNGYYLQTMRQESLRRTPWSIHEAIMKRRANQEPINFTHRVDSRIISIPTSNTVVQYYRKDLPEGVNPDTLMGVYSEIKARANNNLQLAKEVLRIASETGIEFDPDLNSLSEEALQELAATYIQRFEFSVVKYPEILKILTLPSDEETPLKRVTFFFYSIIKNRLDLPNTAENGLWSPQEEAFIKMFFMLFTCIQGKNGAICDMYRQECQGAETSSSQTELIFSRQDEERYNHLIGYTQPLKEEIGKFIKFIHDSYENPDLYMRLRGIFSSSNLGTNIHDQYYIKNTFGKLVDLPWDYEFDWYADFNLQSNLWELREPAFRKTLQTHIDLYFPKSSFNAAFKAIWEKINEDIRNDPSGKLATMISEFIEDDYHDRTFDFTYAPDDVDEFNPIIGGITESAYIALLIKLGVLRKRETTFKVSPSEGLTAPQISERLKDALPIEVLDLSGNTQLSIQEIFEIVGNCNNLRQLNLSGCTQIDDSVLQFLLTTISTASSSKIDEIVLKGIPNIHNIVCSPLMPKTIMDPGRTVQLAIDKFKVTVSTDSPIDFISIAKNCPDMDILAVLNFHAYEFSNKQDIAKILMQLGVEDLDFTSYSALGRYQKEILDAIIEAKYPLKSLNTSCEFDPSKIANIVCVFAKMERFSLRNINIDAELLKTLLGTAKDLELIRLEGVNIIPSNGNETNRIFDETSPLLQKLQTIQLLYTNTHEDDILSMITNSSQLEDIDLTGFSNISFLPILNVMSERFTEMESIVINFSNLTVDDFPLLGMCIKNNPKLTLLSLATCSFLTKQFLSDITGAMPNLEHLGIGFVDHIHEEQTRSLILNCPKLKYLELLGYYNNILSDVEVALHEFPELKTIKLNPWSRLPKTPESNNEFENGVYMLNGKFPKRKFWLETNHSQCNPS